MHFADGALTDTVRRNVITGNTGAGVLVSDSLRSARSRSRSAQNAIYGNSGLGIDLGIVGGRQLGDGVTLNDGAGPYDGDDGPNAPAELPGAVGGRLRRRHHDLRFAPHDRGRDRHDRVLRHARRGRGPDRLRRGAQLPRRGHDHRRRRGRRGRPRERHHPDQRDVPDQRGGGRPGDRDRDRERPHLRVRAELDGRRGEHHLRHGLRGRERRREPRRRRRPRRRGRLPLPRRRRPGRQRRRRRPRREHGHRRRRELELRRPAERPLLGGRGLARHHGHRRGCGAGQRLGRADLRRQLDDRRARPRRALRRPQRERFRQRRRARDLRARGTRAGRRRERHRGRLGLQLQRDRQHARRRARRRRRRRAPAAGLAPPVPAQLELDQRRPDLGVRDHRGGSADDHPLHRAARHHERRRPRRLDRGRVPGHPGLQRPAAHRAERRRRLDLWSPSRGRLERQHDPRLRDQPVHHRRHRRSISPNKNVVQGNYIGTNATGTADGGLRQRRRRDRPRQRLVEQHHRRHAAPRPAT